MKKDLKVLLPETSFPMRAELPKREPEILELWESQNLYRKMLLKNEGHPKFVLHDGPPYPNGPVHLGTALNKILKDIIVKYKSMTGFQTPYIPGWDCHGLPIEHALLKDLKLEKRQVDRLDFMKKARAFAEKYIAIQKEDFKRLGVLGDWENPYLTMSAQYVKAELATFRELLMGGYIYREYKPVYWCANCETALAEAEVEYAEKESPSIYVKLRVSGWSGLIGPRGEFGIQQQFPFIGKNESLYILIWTTTPWTLPANQALQLDPSLEYAVVRLSPDAIQKVEKQWNRETAGGDRSEFWILLKDRVEAVLTGIFQLEKDEYKVEKTVSAEKFEGLSCEHPIFQAGSSPCLSARGVSAEEGTGIVHIAPGHGQEDYQIGRAHQLEIFSPVDEDGKFSLDPEVVPLASRTGSLWGRGISPQHWSKDLLGRNVWETNPMILKYLGQLGPLLHAGVIRHSYPHCWRCKNPVIFRATPQWFLKVDHKDLRKRMLKDVTKVRWEPSYGLKRISGMLEARPDWCLSRQRHWGAPIPILYCEKCDEPLRKEEILRRIIDEILYTEGPEAWFSQPAAHFLSGETRCPCGGKKFRKDEDILDVWFDSGNSWAAVLEQRPELQGAKEVMYLEGSDQHRGWFQTSLIQSMACRGKPPYQTVLTHGFLLDAEGKAMHKSAGNVIAPQEILKKYGADILRLWVASSDYREDIRFSEENLMRSVDSYRKIRNTFRYLLGNLKNFKPDEALPDKNLFPMDLWALFRLSRFVGDCRRAYEAFEFHKALHLIQTFCVEDLSALYLDALKDRLYTYPEKSRERLSAQTALYHILMDLSSVTAPILTFTLCDLWRHLPFEPPTESPLLMDFPESKKISVDEVFWEKVIDLRREVYAELEKIRQAGAIGSSLEARAVLRLPKEEANLLEGKWDVLLECFILSKIEILADSKRTIEVSHAEGKKCQRCWRWSLETGEGGFCKRCEQFISS